MRHKKGTHRQSRWAFFVLVRPTGIEPVAYSLGESRPYILCIPYHT